MQNKFSKFLAVSLLAAFGIVACDDVEARPNKNGSSDSTQIISFKDVDVYGNNYESINDKIHGTINTTALDGVLYAYAINMAGPFNRTVAKRYASMVDIDGQALDGDSLITLEDVVNDSSKVANFVSQYKVYEVLNEDGSHNTTKEYEYIKARYDSIESAIKKNLFLKLKNGVHEYQFDEKELLIALYSGGSKVENPYKLTSGYTTGLVLVPEIEVDDIFTKVLHRNFYSSDKNTYVEDEIIPGIYTDILTQQYIFDKQEGLLGSSYARKINYVAISYNGLENALTAQKLVEGFVTEYLLTSNTTDILDAFKLLSSTWNGAFMGEDNVTSSPEWDLLKKSGLVETLAVGGCIKQASGKYYIDGTAYGTLVEDFSLYNVNPHKSINSEDYTDNGSYVRDIGFKLAQTQISLKDFTRNGWYVKGGDNNELPSSITDRLYNLLVSTGINNDSSSTLSKDADGKWSDTDNNKFVTAFDYGNGNKQYFLHKGARKVNEEAFEDIIFNDSSSSTFYIVNVEEAVSPNYMKECTDYATKIAVAELLSTNDSYIDLAKRYFIEKCDIKYHDQSVYDYFEETFPELFED